MDIAIVRLDLLEPNVNSPTRVVCNPLAFMEAFARWTVTVVSFIVSVHRTTKVTGVNI